jgi:hypothetical protein
MSTFAEDNCQNARGKDRAKVQLDLSKTSHLVTVAIFNSENLSHDPLHSTVAGKMS